ncbi:hypothetical protein GCM10025855_41950 [Shewanella glacialipiscicola]|uniref:Uncharacterized protein n=1 Tax=Shewanella glacialipiscicola TaxID=614069 RepID=A0ABQ6J909_9GAMM|nr:hypothetical protein GCM10025855_41950 [Shewanella glacialipiscicola]
MAEKFTKSMARNIYYGGSFFFVIAVGVVGRYCPSITKART